MHCLGDENRSQILNNEFRRQYDAFLSNSIEKTSLSAGDTMCYAYFLLLQDRISEGIEKFRTINRSDLEQDGGLILQYDYMSAFIDFYIGADTNYQAARAVVDKYKDYPILHWKFLFDEVRDQLSEFDGRMELDHEIDQEDEDAKKQNLKKSKELEPYLNAEIKGYRIQVDYVNVESIEIKYYFIDPEILFSRAPFLVQETEDFAFVKPSEVSTAILNPAQRTELIDIEKRLINVNMIVEVSGQGKQVFLRYFSTSLKVIINENYGELKVTTKGGKALAEVYVKVFSKNKAGEVKFFRDGYTDLNGKFEYAQINSKSLTDIDRFAMFVSSETHGSLTKE